MKIYNYGKWTVCFIHAETHWLKDHLPLPPVNSEYRGWQHYENGMPIRVWYRPSTKTKGDVGHIRFAEWQQLK